MLEIVREILDAEKQAEAKIAEAKKSAESMLADADRRAFDILKEGRETARRDARKLVENARNEAEDEYEKTVKAENERVHRFAEEHEVTISGIVDQVIKLVSTGKKG